MKDIFRWIVLLSLVGTILLWVLPYMEALWLSEDDMRARALFGMGSWFSFSMLYYWGYFAVWVACHVGLYFYVRIARPLFLVLVGYSLLSAFMFGWQVSPPYEVMLIHVVTICEGAILAIAFLTSVSKKFSVASDDRRDADDGR